MDEASPPGWRGPVRAAMPHRIISQRGPAHARGDDRNRLCGPRLGRLFRRLRPQRGVHRQGRVQDRPAESRRHSHLRAWPGRPGGQQRAGRPAELRHRPGPGDRGGRRGVHRRGHAVAARRRPCGPVLCPRRRRGDRGPDAGLHRGGDQVHRAGGHRRRDRAHHPRAPAGRRVRRGLQPRVPARGRGHRGLQAPRPGRCRRRGRARARR